jgi:hypothetical protein
VITRIIFVCVIYLFVYRIMFAGACRERKYCK